ncbi:MAG TPA: zf-TFIIB domain-containing protein [Kamptonema sp.]|nr:zf-TFIIB domain-containing protein [Kamptonema sp.]
MQCPKCKHPELEEGMLNNHLSVKWCPNCYGIWMPSKEYQGWQEYQRQWPSKSQPKGTVSPDFAPSPYDAKAAMCPDDGQYLSRARIPFTKTPVYVERCSVCGGIWCDSGEWEILESMGLHAQIEQLFSSAWQAKARLEELAQRERQGIIDKLGEELSQYVFALAEVLEDHPNGDFAASYILRRFESKRKGIRANG